MGIDARLIQERCTQLGITDEEFFKRTGEFPSQLEEGTTPHPVSVDALTRIAELLHLLPSDLVADLPARDDWDLADVMLLEFALNDAPRAQSGLGRLLGWSYYRIQRTLIALLRYPSASTHRLGVLEDWWFTLEPAEYGQHPQEREAYALWFATRTAPDPFDAIALLRTLHARQHGPSGAPVAFVSPALLQRLSARHLAVAVEGEVSRELAENGIDVPIQPHPDLLFALDLGGPPPPRADPPTRGA